MLHIAPETAPSSSRFVANSRSFRPVIETNRAEPRGTPIVVNPY
jgi:hypothetical protein